MNNVLLFEDDGNDLVGGLLRTMQEHGCHVTVTGRIDDARRLIERTNFDLVIVNILLPKETAFEVLELAQQRGIRTFLSTGSMQSDQGAAALGCGRGVKDRLHHTV